MRQLIGAGIFGVAGVAVLVSLGVWQLNRLDWKMGVIGAIEARIHEAPVALPTAPDPVADRYLPVQVSGDYTGEMAHVLSSRPGTGVGTLVIAVLQTDDGRRVMVDRGFIAEGAPGVPAVVTADVTVTGNLMWPDDADGYTPEPDRGRNLWFSRAVDPLATFLQTEPVLIIARADARVPGLIGIPVNSADVKNDHLGYAITWFLLAFVWAGMTLFLMWRIRHDTP